MTDSNGASRYQSDKVRVAIIGAGNCASSFVQGVHYYRDADPSERVPGLMHVDLGGYHVHDVEFTAAFDVTEDKVGKDLAEAIWAGQNNTIKFADVPKLDVPVLRGMTHDGLGKYLSERIEKAPGALEADAEAVGEDADGDVVDVARARLDRGDEPLLQRRRHPDENTFAISRRHVLAEQTASTIAAFC